MRHDEGHFFFLHAEDGIRHDLVTGVQTCALPISSAHAPPALSAGEHVLTAIARDAAGNSSAASRRSVTVQPGLVPPPAITKPANGETYAARSEERRVGKERAARTAVLSGQHSTNR